MCPCGMYGSILETCSPCIPGTYNNNNGSRSDSACLSCIPGYFSGAKACYCDMCPANTFSSVGSSECVACPMGFESPPGSSSCHLTGGIILQPDSKGNENNNSENTVTYVMLSIIVVIGIIITIVGYKKVFRKRKQSENIPLL